MGTTVTLYMLKFKILYQPVSLETYCKMFMDCESVLPSTSRIGTLSNGNFPPEQLQQFSM